MGDAKRLFLANAPTVIPAEWRRVGNEVLDGMGIPYRAYVSRFGMQAILSLDDYQEAGMWLHLSVSRPDALPSWNDLKRCKETFLGDRLAIQILPPRSAYINIHPNVLHLFARLDAETIPEAIWNQETGR